jgi:hypothetical protein
MERAKKTPRSCATKLSDADYKDIRKFYNDGMHINTIRRTYRIGNERVNKIINDSSYLAGGAITSSAAINISTPSKHKHKHDLVSENYLKDKYDKIINQK